LLGVCHPFVHVFAPRPPLALGAHNTVAPVRSRPLYATQASLSVLPDFVTMGNVAVNVETVKRWAQGKKPIHTIPKSLSFGIDDSEFCKFEGPVELHAVMSRILTASFLALVMMTNHTIYQLSLSEGGRHARSCR
jgi:hypothetical protein